MLCARVHAISHAQFTAAARGPARPVMYGLLTLREVAGTTLSLSALPAGLVKRVEKGGMLSLLVSAEQLLARRCAGWGGEAAAFGRIVGSIDEMVNAGEGNVHRREFLELGGPSLLARALSIPLDSQPSEDVRAALSKTLQVLTDVCTAEPAKTRHLSGARGFMSSLFGFMRYPDLLEWSLGLLLASGDELFPLSAVENLDGLVESLSPKGMALFCRALAGLFSRHDEPTSG